MKKTKTLVFTALFAAMICVMTMVHIPSGNGYVHAGDGIIYIAACILPFPFGIFAGGIGGAMSDLFSGYAIYIIPTLIVKSLNAGCFYLLKSGEKLFCKRNILISGISGLVTVVGYYIVAVILYGGAVAQLSGLPANFLQAFASTILFCGIALALDKAKIQQNVLLK
ncbi:MAG: TIGR04002 family protein [Oscillospiraceae bacterium]